MMSRFKDEAGKWARVNAGIIRGRVNRLQTSVSCRVVEPWTKGKLEDVKES